MPKSQIDAVALIAAIIAGGVAVMLSAGQLAHFASLAGLLLLLIIFAYDRDGYRSVFQSLAFSSVCGFCLALAAAAAFRAWWTLRDLSARDDRETLERLAGYSLLIWAGATVIFWAIDRARMKTRETPTVEYRREPARRTGTMFDIGSGVTTSPTPHVVTQETPRAPEPAETPVESVHVETTRTPQPAVQIQTPARPGKEVMVYVGLVGEGLNVLRSVTAEHVGRNYYRIVESMPQGETWEYGPGQIVRCEKKRLSSGKALVAVEEAPRQA